MGSIKSMTDVAYDVISKKKRCVPFVKLWEKVSLEAGISDNSQIAQFYSDLTLDGRFVSLKDNKWDLKERRTFEETFVDLSLLEVEDDEEEGTSELEEDILEEVKEEDY